MRILIVTQYFWPEEFRINDLALGLKARGHEVVVLTGQPNYPKGKFFSGYGFFGPFHEEYHGAKVLRVPLVPRDKKQPWRLALNYFSFAFFASFLGPWYCRGKFDVVFVYEPSPVTVGFPGVVFKILKRAPMMFWVQDLWPESLSATGAVKQQWILNCVAKFVRWIYRHSDTILVQSKGFTEHTLAMGVSREKIKYLPNWAEELYTPVVVEDDAPERQHIPNGFVVMFAGNIGIAQDFPTILKAAEALKSHKDIHWVVLGDGSEREWVKNEIEKRGLSESVHLLGRHPVETMPRYFALADVMLVSLTSDPIFALTIPGKVQSYLACGRPIIAALDGEGARIIEEARAGITCSAEDYRALAKAVLTMKDIAIHEREEMGLRGRLYYETHFNRAILIDRVESLMQALCKKQSR